jgi:hypothetical protein
LFAYLTSHPVRDVVGGRREVIDDIIGFLRRHVLVHDEYFLFYLKKWHRFLDVAHNSAHEGTNSGIKSHAARVVPSQTLLNAAKALSLQGQLKASSLQWEAGREFSQRKLWSTLPTSSFLLTVAESMLQQNWERHMDYHARRVAVNLFEVHYSKEGGSNCEAPVEINRDERIELNDNSDDDDDEKSDDENLDTLNDDEEPEQREIRPMICNSPVPLFRRIRMVQLHKDGSMQCSCCLFERTGLPCIHIHKVVQISNDEWKGFTHHDVDVRWWTCYAVYAYSNNSGQLGRLLQTMNTEGRKNKPFFNATGDLSCFANIPIVGATPLPSLIDTVSNYSRQELTFMLSKTESLNEGSVDSSPLDLGYSQTLFTAADHGDNDHDDNSDVRINLFEKSLDLLGNDDDGEENRNIRATLKPYFEETVSVLESMLVGADEMVDSVKQFHREIIARGRANMQEQSQENPSLTTPIIAGMRTKRNCYNHRETVSVLENMQEQSEQNPSLTVPRIAGMLTEKHRDKRRTFITHQQYYR